MTIYLIIIGYLICSVLAYGRVVACESAGNYGDSSLPRAFVICVLLGPLMFGCSIVQYVLIGYNEGEPFLLYRNPQKAAARKADRELARALRNNDKPRRIPTQPEESYDFNTREAPEMYSWR